VTDAVDPPEPAPPPDDLRRNSALVAAGIALSRLAGLGREVATAAFLGTGAGADAFRAALRIPNLLQNLLGEGVLSASFIPVYSRLLAEGEREQAGRLAGAVAGLLLVVTTTIVAVAVVFAEPLTRVFAPGFAADPAKFELTVTLVRIITPGVGFLVLSAWCLGILNSHRRFFLSYVAPVIWNVAIVAALLTAALAAATELGIARAMAIGALTGSVLQFVVQLPAVLRRTGRMDLRPSLTAPGVPTVLRRFGEVVAGRGGVQLASYLDLILASLLAGGAVAALGYAHALYLLPIGLFGMSVAAAELPTLSTIDHTDRAAVVDRLDRALGRVAFFVLPAAVAFVLAGDLVAATVYQSRRFEAADAVQVGIVLGVYGLGLLASTSTRVLQSSLYGYGDTRRPAMYAITRVVVALLVGVALMFPMDTLRAIPGGVEVAEVFRWRLTPEELRAAPGQLRLGAAGLALGASIGAWLEFGLLRRRVQGVFGRIRLGGPHAGALATGTLVAAAVAFAVRPLLAVLELPARLEGLLGLGLIGGAYLLTTWLLRVPEARDLPLLRRPPRQRD
jgi:putative peptidoglycan lipid II flippase